MRHHIVLWCCWCALIHAAREPLRLKPDGTFTIMQVTDTHFWDEQERDAKTTALLTSLLQHETPDFIAHTGDAVHSTFVKNGAASFFALWNKMVGLFRGIPYAVSLGNHDQDADFITPQAILDNDRTHANCYSAAGDGAGPYNYYVDVLNSHDDAVAWRMWFFNSGPDMGWCEHERSAGCVSPDVISWAYMHGCNETIPSLVFVHIPIGALLDMENMTGTRQDNSPIQAINTGLDSFALRCGARAMTFGHMHGNDFVGTYARQLAGRGSVASQYGYGRNTGYGYHGAAELQRGARMFRVDRRGEMNTWIRQEDGTRVDYNAYHNLWREQAWAWVLYMCLIAVGVVLVPFFTSLAVLHWAPEGAKSTYTRLP